MKHIRVLIVDDCSLIRKILTRILEQDEDILVVGAAESPDEATGILSERTVDVVTLDIEMPGTNGLEYLASLNTLGIPVIMLSGRAAEEADARFLSRALGVTTWFNKMNAVCDADGLIGLVKAAAIQKVHVPPEVVTPTDANDRSALKIRRA